MKSTILLLFLVVATKISFAQNAKKNIDYQYHRDGKIYYAYEIYKNPASAETIFYLNFSASKTFNKIEKIYLKEGKVTEKLKFKMNDITIKNDNKELKFYAIILNSSDINKENISCNPKIIFKLDDESVYELPFQKCVIVEQLAKP
ncbi:MULTISPECIES: hypothetical protein [unclassified Pedobacter]|uniref:hypothetical protein n=1 Tax=unclassified Pedobacter TaxID=2628915 RepID=UPI001E2AB9A0|nr:MULTISPECIES: hypothetical protein [unclassified Pedobacter]